MPEFDDSDIMSPEQIKKMKTQNAEEFAQAGLEEVQAYRPRLPLSRTQQAALLASQNHSQAVERSQPAVPQAFGSFEISDESAHTAAEQRAMLELGKDEEDAGLRYIQQSFGSFDADNSSRVTAEEVNQYLTSPIADRLPTHVRNGLRAAARNAGEIQREVSDEGNWWSNDYQGMSRDDISRRLEQ